MVLQKDMTTIATGKVLHIGELTMRHQCLPHITALLVRENLHAIKPMLNLLALDNDTGCIPIAFASMRPALSRNNIIERTEAAIAIKTTISIGVTLVIQNLELATYAAILSDKIFNSAICSLSEFEVNR